jgi:hypothetical protein
VTHRVDELPAARAEYLDAVAFYENLRAGLGRELIDRFEEAVRAIRDDPTAWPRVDGGVGDVGLRSHRVTAFPFRIVYFASERSIHIVAYAHERRRPGYWLSRAPR